MNLQQKNSLSCSAYILSPGQMTANAGFGWSDGVEPVLLEIMEGISQITKTT